MMMISSFLITDAAFSSLQMSGYSDWCLFFSSPFQPCRWRNSVRLSVLGFRPVCWMVGLAVAMVMSAVVNTFVLFFFGCWTLDGRPGVQLRKPREDESIKDKRLFSTSEFVCSTALGEQRGLVLAGRQLIPDGLGTFCSDLPSFDLALMLLDGERQHPLVVVAPTPPSDPGPNKLTCHV